MEVGDGCEQSSILMQEVVSSKPFSANLCEMSFARHKGQDVSLSSQRLTHVVHPTICPQQGDTIGTWQGSLQIQHSRLFFQSFKDTHFPLNCI